jgi:hypothetical protein
MEVEALSGSAGGEGGATAASSAVAPSAGVLVHDSATPVGAEDLGKQGAAAVAELPTPVGPPAAATADLVTAQQQEIAAQPVDDQNGAGLGGVNNDGMTG